MPKINILNEDGEMESLNIPSSEELKKLYYSKTNYGIKWIVSKILDCKKENN